MRQIELSPTSGNGHASSTPFLGTMPALIMKVPYVI